MTDLRQMNKEFLIEFIEMYRSLPCIWKVKSGEYSDRVKKSKAYEQLLTKLKESDKNATVTTVKKKIDSLRGSFRKELKKVKESNKSGAGTEEVYKPRLWYFDHLLFLADQHIPSSGVDNAADNSRDHDSNNLEVKSECEWTPDEQYEDTTMSPTNSMDLKEPVETPRSTSRSSSAHSRARPYMKRKRSDQVLEKVQKKINEPQPVEDQFDVIGKNFANKLRALPCETAIIAEKCMMDILYEAYLGNVNRDSRVIIRNERSLSGIMNHSQGSAHGCMPQIPQADVQ